MPIYLYKCVKCGNKIEVLRSLSGGIPLCCDKTMARVPTAPMLRFRGEHGNSPTRKWCESWYPGKPTYSTGSLHGEKY